MADNITIKDGNSVDKVVRSTDNAGVHTPHHIVANFPTDGAKEAKQDTIIVGLSDILTKLIASPATSAKQDIGNTTLSDILAKLITAPSTEAKQDALGALLTSIIKDEDSLHTSGDKGIMLLGIRNDSDTSTAGDGDYTVLKLDEEGRLKIAAKPASYPDVTGDITAVQATIGTPVAGGTVIGDVSRVSNVMMFCTGTFSTVNCTFEGSLESTGENWFGVQAVRSNANTIETTTGNLSASPAYAWELSVNGLARVRVRCTARTSGTQSWRFKLGAYATEPIPAAQISGTQPVSFTQPALVAGTAAIGDVGLQYRANATGAASISKVNSAASTNAGVIKAGAGRVTAYQLINTTGSIIYVKLHNTTTAPTVGTTAVALVIPIPANGKAELDLAGGVGFTTGISISIVTGSSDTDATAVTAGAVVGSIFFA